MSAYSVIIAHLARKQIDALPAKIRERIASALQLLSRNPFLGKALKAELRGLYSHRVGDYRIIYAMARRKLIVEVVKVMHRREAYR